MLTLVFVTTTDCNLNCKHCLRGGASGIHLPFEIVEKAVAGARKFGIEGLHLTGGEPFLYKNLPSLLNLAYESVIPLTFSSNGLLLEKNLELLKKYKKIIRLINISLDGCVADIHEKIRGKGTFRRALDAFDLCRRHKLPFGILFCVNKINFQNLNDVARFAREQKAARVSFSTVLPCANSRENDLVLNVTEREKLWRDLTKVVRLSSLDVFKLFYVPVFISESIQAWSNIVMCLNQSLRMITIDVDASVHFCCFLTVYDVSADVARRIRVASLNKLSFDEGVKVFSEAVAAFLSGRIEDYREGLKTDNPDFNSCFYCNKKFGL